MIADKIKELKSLSFETVKSQILSDLNSEDFNWEEFLELFLNENSPLLNIFSFKSMSLAQLHSSINKSAEITNQIED